MHAYGRKGRRAAWLVAALAVTAAISLVGSPLASAQPTGDADQVQLDPMVEVSTDTTPDKAPAEAQARRAPEADCPIPAEGQRAACGGFEPLQPDQRRSDGLAGRSSVAPQAIQPVPDWCFDDPYTGFWGVRDRACEIGYMWYEEYETVNGVTSTVGHMDMNVISTAFLSTGQGTWSHQFQVSPYNSWGTVTTARIEANAIASGQCLTSSVSFPNAPLTLNSTPGGEAFFNSTSTNPGNVGECITKWQPGITNPSQGFTTPHLYNYFEMTPVRCDTATVGRPGTGCVIPWYAAGLIYSASSYNTLADHVTKAQQSGLPGATFDRPLTRTENQAIIDQNRNLACGGHWGPTSTTCDEYPVATSYEGLSQGGTKRLFRKWSAGEGVTGRGSGLVSLR
ncbi:hypothetical protein [Pseudonocardia sp. WMMC193]|uniref:hypothetical protein n=1 Tax=Pseudonocardia sp. WMMC193 TaxID=2911965 RepID=UPI001F2B3F67|nr:hypothetical protein [Pseudonocardia sp. WMMC193]MCF7547356.1 hypothetical protein [Pseudonocardia sp. WMMC193]